MQCVSILVVEDDIAARESLRELLELEGYAVQVAANGFEAAGVLSMISGPCLVIVDLKMPVLDGAEFIQLAEETSDIFPIPIIVVSGMAEEFGATSPNIKAVLGKPYDPQALLSVVAENMAKAG